MGGCAAPLHATARPRPRRLFGGLQRGDPRPRPRRAELAAPAAPRALPADGAARARSGRARARRRAERARAGRAARRRAHGARAHGAGRADDSARLQRWSRWAGVAALAVRQAGSRAEHARGEREGPSARAISCGTGRVSMLRRVMCALQLSAVCSAKASFACFPLSSSAASRAPCAAAQCRRCLACAAVSSGSS